MVNTLEPKPVPTKVVTTGAISAAAAAGRTVAFGGGGTQRKPMELARGLAASGAGNLDVIAFLAGPAVDLLLGLGRVRSLLYAYAGFDGLGLAPNYRIARQAGAIAVRELSEGMFLAGAEAGARGVPFHPSRSGTVGDIIDLPGSPVRRFSCPITGEALVAVPAIRPDVLLLHVDLADEFGNLAIAGDPFLDELLAHASGAVYASAESVVPDLRAEGLRNHTVISRVWVDGVCEIPRGSGFTSVYPSRPMDWIEAAHYQAKATDREWLENAVAQGQGWS